MIMNLKKGYTVLECTVYIWCSIILMTVLAYASTIALQKMYRVVDDIMVYQTFSTIYAMMQRDCTQAPTHADKWIATGPTKIEWHDNTGKKSWECINKKLIYTSYTQENKQHREIFFEGQCSGVFCINGKNNGFIDAVSLDLKVDKKHTTHKLQCVAFIAEMYREL